MSRLKIGILEEGKVPPDERVTFTPEQCKEIERQYDCDVFIQESAVRRISNEAYSSAGNNLIKNVENCDVLFGVKEVPIDRLLNDKTYFFFSHTIKEQPYNRELLRAILEKNIRLIDYECLVDEKELRLLGFGRFAGLVGTYNGLRMIGIKEDRYHLKKAVECVDQEHLFEELKKVDLPPIKICLTGKGRVSHGAEEILNYLNIRQVSVEEYLNQSFEEAVFVQLAVTDYNKRKDGSEGEMFDFFHNPTLYDSNFMRFSEVTDFYIACHFWDAHSPKLINEEELAAEKFNIRYIADISCDIDGPIASTIRSSSIENPFYGIKRSNREEVDFMEDDALAVMAVDNLPCELPVDASKDFGEQLMKWVIPALFDGDSQGILERATIAQSGKLTERFSYLKDYVEGR